MLLMAVSGMVTIVELLGFVALNMIKLNAPSAFVAFFVILIVAASTLVAEIEIRKIVINVTTKSRFENMAYPIFF